MGAKLSSFADARVLNSFFIVALFDENLTHVQKKIFSPSFFSDLKI